MLPRCFLLARTRWRVWKHIQEGKKMINKLAVAMIFGSMTVLPAAAASAQQATGSNGVTSNNAGQKPTNKEGLPTNCMAGDTASS